MQHWLWSQRDLKEALRRSKVLTQIYSVSGICLSYMQKSSQPTRQGLIRIFTERGKQYLKS